MIKNKASTQKNFVAYRFFLAGAFKLETLGFCLPAAISMDIYEE